MTPEEHAKLIYQENLQDIKTYCPASTDFKLIARRVSINCATRLIMHTPSMFPAVKQHWIEVRNILRDNY